MSNKLKPWQPCLLNFFILKNKRINPSNPIHKKNPWTQTTLFLNILVIIPEDEYICLKTRIKTGKIISRKLLSNAEERVMYLINLLSNEFFLKKVRINRCKSIGEVAISKRSYNILFEKQIFWITKQLREEAVSKIPGIGPKTIKILLPKK